MATRGLRRPFGSPQRRVLGGGRRAPLLACIGALLTLGPGAVHASDATPPSQPTAEAGASLPPVDAPADIGSIHWIRNLSRECRGETFERVIARLRSGLQLEHKGAFVDSARTYEEIVEQAPATPQSYWRIARNYWREGDRLRRVPEAEPNARLRLYELAEEWARRGIDVDDRCAECMLWRYAALGRIGMARGALVAARSASTMRRLLDRAIALKPTHRDSEVNSTLGNLYYARAIFNRMVPDWFWLPLIVGVRGDKELALRDIETAVSISGGRIDYLVEKGAVLLCLGTTKHKPERTKEGVALLRSVLTMEQRVSSDATDLEYAARLLETPEKSCGYTQDGFVDVEEMGESL